MSSTEEVKKTKPNDLGYGPHFIKPIDADPEGYGNMTGTLSLLISMNKHFGSSQKVIDDLSKEQEAKEKELAMLNLSIQRMKSYEQELKEKIPSLFDPEINENSIRELNDATNQLVKLWSNLDGANWRLTKANEEFSEFLKNKEKKTNEMLDNIKVLNLYNEGVKVLDTLQAEINKTFEADARKKLEDNYASEKKKIEIEIADILAQY